MPYCRCPFIPLSKRFFAKDKWGKRFTSGITDHPTTYLQILRQVLRRILKPSGRLYAVMPNKYWLGDILSTWTTSRETPPFQRIERVATQTAWRHWLEQHGFEVLAVRPFRRYTPLLINGKLRSLRKFTVRRLLNLLTPTNLAGSILSVCRPAPTIPHITWLWRAKSST